MNNWCVISDLTKELGESLDTHAKSEEQGMLLNGTSVNDTSLLYFHSWMAFFLLSLSIKYSLYHSSCCRTSSMLLPGISDPAARMKASWFYR